VTTTLPRQPVRTRNRVRRGIVYGFYVTHPITGEVCWGYVGQTRQDLDDREDQHRECQPWADTIVGDARRDPITGRVYQAVILAQGDWDDTELDAREIGYINYLKPLYNIVANRSNPSRVKPWEAKKQRHQRDRAAGRPLWRPTPKRVPISRPDVVRYQPRRRPVPFRINWGLVLVAQLWIVFTGGMVWASGGHWLLSLGASTAVVVGLWLARLLLGAVRRVRRWLRPRRRRYRHR
jgi:hypothetical protein